MKRRLVTPQEILTLHYKGIHCLTVPPHAIVTPGAKDLILALSFTLNVGEEEPAQQARAEPEPAPAATDDPVRRIVADLAPQLDEELREKVIEVVREQLTHALKMEVR